MILASGSVPRTIPGFEPDGTRVVTSDEFFHIPQVPVNAIVIGGGAIGCEFASTLADLGSEVTILEALPKILPLCDQDVTRVVQQSFKRRGITVRTGVSVTGHTPIPERNDRASRGWGVTGDEPGGRIGRSVALHRRPSRRGRRCSGRANVATFRSTRDTTPECRRCGPSGT